MLYYEVLFLESDEVLESDEEKMKLRMPPARYANAYWDSILLLQMPAEFKDTIESIDTDD